MSDTQNINCLKGFQCPACGHTEDFRIEVTVLALVTDYGVEDGLSGSTWDDDAPCECANCDHAGKVRDFGSKPYTGTATDAPDAGADEQKALTRMLLDALETQAMADADPEAPQQHKAPRAILSSPPPHPAARRWRATTNRFAGADASHTATAEGNGADCPATSSSEPSKPDRP